MPRKDRICFTDVGDFNFCIASVLTGSGDNNKWVIKVIIKYGGEDKRYSFDMTFVFIFV